MKIPKTFMCPGVQLIFFYTKPPVEDERRSKPMERTDPWRPSRCAVERCLWTVLVIFKGNANANIITFSNVWCISEHHNQTIVILAWRVPMRVGSLALYFNCPQGYTWYCIFISLYMSMPYHLHMLSHSMCMYIWRTAPHGLWLFDWADPPRAELARTRVVCYQPWPGA